MVSLVCHACHNTPLLPALLLLLGLGWCRGGAPTVCADAFPSASPSFINTTLPHRPFSPPPARPTHKNRTLKQQEEEGATAAATDADAPPPISQEKKEWLEKVMEGTFMDVAKRMQVLLGELGPLATATGDATSTTNDDEAAELWEELQEHVENLDYALMFCQVQGLPTLFRFLAQAQAHPDNPQAQTRALPALAVLATLTQNNPPAQEEVLKYPVAGEARGGVVTLLASFVLRDRDKHTRNSRFIAKTLQALSCTVRGNAAAEDAFLGRFGLQVFTAALGGGEEEDERVQAKALFFLQALLGADHATQARGQQLAPLLPLVVPGLLHDDLSVRHTAACVVSELANLLGGPAVVLEGPGGKALEEAMETRQAAIAALSGVDLEEAQDEVRFWEVLATGGVGRRFLRDGETEESVGGGVGAGAVMQEEKEEEGGGSVGGNEEEEAPAVLLLAPPTYLSGASNAP